MIRLVTIISSSFSFWVVCAFYAGQTCTLHFSQSDSLFVELLIQHELPQLRHEANGNFGSLLGQVGSIGPSIQISCKERLPRCLTFILMHGSWSHDRTSMKIMKLRFLAQSFWNQRDQFNTGSRREFFAPWHSIRLVCAGVCFRWSQGDLALAKWDDIRIMLESICNVWILTVFCGDHPWAFQKVASGTKCPTLWVYIGTLGMFSQHALAW